MRILFVSKSASLLPVAWRVQEEGHKVHCVLPGGFGEGEGFVPVEYVPNAEELTHVGVLEAIEDVGYDFAVCDGLGLGTTRELLHKRSPTLGPVPLTDRAQTDTSFAERMFRLAGIPTPPARTFRGNKDGAIRYARECNCPMIMRTPHGTWAPTKDAHEAISYVSIMLAPEITLQTRPPGIEVVHGGWFDGHSFATPLVTSFWWHTLMPGDLGPCSVEPTGTSGWLHWDIPLLHKESLAKLVPILRKADFRGGIALRLVLQKEDLFALELMTDITTFYPFLDGYKKVADLLYNVAHGRAAWKPRNRMYGSAALYTSHAGVPIGGLVDGNVRHLWLQNARKVDGIPYAIGGRIGYVTAWGTDAGEARRRVNRTMQTIKILDVGYRNDIGRTTSRWRDQLAAWHWF